MQRPTWLRDRGEVQHQSDQPFWQARGKQGMRISVRLCASLYILGGLVGVRLEACEVFSAQ